MIESEQYVKLVQTYFNFLITEFDFRLSNKSIKGNVFYDIQFENETRKISISYENIEDHFLVIVYLLQNGELPDYDDKTRTLHLNILNSILLPEVSKSEIDVNNNFFSRIQTNNEFERRVLKSAKDLRLCLKYFDNVFKW